MPDIRVDYTPGRFDILMWSGQADKNNVDIYDGGIFRQESGRVGVVRFYDGQWWIHRKKSCGGTLLYDECLHGEVIGHKYSDKHLLPGKEGGE